MIANTVIIARVGVRQAGAGIMAGGEGQLFLDLASGIGMFGNGQASPLVQFAEIGNGAYDLDWERLETEGSSNDFVIVGGGIGSSDSEMWGSSIWLHRFCVLCPFFFYRYFPFAFAAGACFAHRLLKQTCGIIA